MTFIDFPIPTKNFSAIPVGKLIFASNYATLGAAIASIGATPTTLIIDTDVAVDSAVTVLDTTSLAAVNGGILTKSGIGSITFQGLGLNDPLSQSPIFSGFAAGDITWTGASYPGQISSSLWNDSTWGARLSRATAALTSKDVSISVFPGGTPTVQVRIKSGQSVYFTRGTYENAINANPWVILESNTSVYGDGIGQTIIKESSVAGQIRGFYADGVLANPFDGYNENISIQNLTIYGDATQSVDSSASAVFLGNCTNGIIRGCEFWGTHGFGAYVGAFATSGYHAQNCYIDHNIFRDLKTQNAGAISGKDIFITNNIFTEMQTDVANPLAVAIDVEPNNTGEYVSNIQILDNIIDARGALQSVSGIIIQIGGSDTSPEFCRIAGNLIIGQEMALPETGALVVGISASSNKGTVINDNTIIGAGQAGISLYGGNNVTVQNNTIINCGGGGNAAMLVDTCTNSRIAFNSIVAQAGFAAANYLDETGTSSNKYIYNDITTINLSGTGTSTNAPIVYA